MTNTITLLGSEGIRLSASAWGDPTANPVLLLHGGGQTRSSWGTTGEALAAAGFQSISVDLRGHGDSEWAPDGDYSMDAMAADVRELIHSFGSAVALVGASIGGVASLAATAELDPKTVWALVLVDIVPKLEPAGTQRIVSFMTAQPEGFATIEEAADAVAKYLDHRPRPTDLSGLAKNLRAGPDGRLHWHWDPRLVRQGFRSRPDRYARLVQASERLRVPVLLVRGKLSEVVSDAGAREFLSLVPHAEFVDISGAGHMVAGDDNDAFAEAVTDFLVRHRPPCSSR